MKGLIIGLLCLLLATPAYAFRITAVRETVGASLYSGQNTITSGTAVQLSYSTAAKKVLVKPTAETKQNIYIGGSNVTSANGFELVTDTVTTIDVGSATSIYAIINDDVEPTASALSYLVIVE